MMWVCVDMGDAVALLYIRDDFKWVDQNKNNQQTNCSIKCFVTSIYFLVH